MHTDHNRGFTLIELMIALAIVTVIAAVAVPSYSDYVRKAEVTEGLGLLQEVKVEVSQTYSATGAFPPGTRTIYLNDSSSDAKFSMMHYHKGNDHTDGGLLELEFGPGANDELVGKRLWLKPTVSDSYITWDCHSHYIDNLKIPDHLLPADCTSWDG